MTLGTYLQRNPTLNNFYLQSGQQFVSVGDSPGDNMRVDEVKQRWPHFKISEIEQPPEGETMLTLHVRPFGT